MNLFRSARGQGTVQGMVHSNLGDVAGDQNSSSDEIMTLNRSTFRLRRVFFAWAAGTALAGLSMPVVAQDIAVGQAHRFSSSEIMGFSLIIGVLSAALISAVWLVRQRGRLENESREIRTALSDAGQKISRYQALIADKNRRIVVWDSLSGEAEFLGQLPIETGAPQNDLDFLAFGKWLKLRSAIEIEKAIEKLRSNAESFDLVIETGRDEVLEAQGRVSGGRAFVRFVALNNLRADLAELQIERERLATTISSFQSLLDAVDLPVWQRDNHGALTWVNHAFGEAVDAKNPKEVIEQKKELLPAVAREKIRAVATEDTPFRDKISTVVHGNRAFFDIVDVKVPTGSSGIAIDMTEIEAVREELSRTHKSHAETLDHLATPVAFFDGSQRLQFYNQAFQRLWDLDIAYLDTRPDNANLLDQLRSQGKLSEQLSWKTWKDNVLSVYRSTETQSDLWYLPNGETLRVFATAHPQGGATWVFENLTEQVNLETRYNTLLKVQGETIDHLAEGVAVFSPDGKITLSNPAFRAIWGVTEKQAAPGTHIRDIEAACSPSYDQNDGWRRFGEIITSFDDHRASIEGKLELSTGLVLDYAVTPLPNAQTMLTFVNVTDSVRAERALMDKNEALRKADDLKNAFVQHVSYELRSPLTNIIGFAELLKTQVTGPLTPRQAEYVEHITTSSSVLLTIVNDILDLATVDAGIVQLDYMEIHLADLLDEVSSQLADRLHESNVSLQIVTDPQLGMIVADHQRLKQILIKILTNAINFSPDGGTIRMRCWREETDFIFTVSDHGPGIPKDVLESVFNRFEAKGKAGKRSGAGLGLSIVESFVGLHNGTVTIDSREGQGTDVTCRIPSGPRPHSAAAE